MDLNNIIITNFDISLQEINIYKSLLLFYNDENNKVLKDILTKSFISLRLIEYFITKYSKLKKINYYVNNILFNIYLSYKQQLKIYQKKYFDPFSRGERIPYFLNDNTYLITTIGQLNFFKWFIEKQIYNYILLHYNNIE